MAESTLVYTIGVLVLITGVLMIVFRRSSGVAFCRLGKWGWKPFQDVPGFNAMIDRIYDERHAPRIFLMLGIVNVAQSPVFFALGYLLA